MQVGAGQAAAGATSHGAGINVGGQFRGQALCSAGVQAWQGLAQGQLRGAVSCSPCGCPSARARFVSARAIALLLQSSCQSRAAAGARSASFPWTSLLVAHACSRRSSERCSRELAARLELVAKVEREVGKTRALMEGVETEIGRKKEVSRKVGQAGRWEGRRGGLGGVGHMEPSRA